MGPTNRIFAKLKLVTGEQSVETYADVPLSHIERYRLYEEILNSSAVQYLSEGPPIVEVGEAMAKRLAEMAEDLGTTDQRIYEAAFNAWCAEGAGR